MTSEEVPANAYWMSKDGLSFAGVHLLIDLWEASGLDDLAVMRSALERCVAACGAVQRGELELFQFERGGGIAGVAMLMQSHLGVHTWPEHGYGAFDTFLCGPTDPYRIIPVLREVFRPRTIQVTECKRGLRV